MKKVWIFFIVAPLFSAFWLVINFGLFTSSAPAKINPLTLKEEFNPDEKIAIFNNQKIDLTDSLTAKDFSEEEKAVLGESDAPKRIEIDLTNQRIYAYEGDRLIYNFLVSTGKWGRTPTGSFRIWTKLRYTKMSGGSRALRTYYYLPNVPYTMYFYSNQIPQSRGFGIHGTYWHSNFGHPMSHGCVNMKTEEAALLYFWADPKLNGARSIRASADNPGTEIIIYGETPRE